MLLDSRAVMAPLSAVLCILLAVCVSGRAISADEDILAAEIRAWRAANMPEYFQVPGPDGEPTWVHLLPNGTHPQMFGILGDYETDVHFHLFIHRNTSDVEGTRIGVNLTREQLMEAGMNPKLETKIIIHGYSSNIRSSIIQNIKNAYLQHGLYNVIGVDWDDLCIVPLYSLARLHVSGVGQRVALFIDNLVQNGVTNLDRTHVIGHSLGAHVSGIAGKNVTGALRRITGLDPAAPLFWFTPPEGRLNETDAQLVDVVHTSAGFLGMTSPVGTIDFYPNGGKNQPGCGFDMFGGCSHGQAHVYFAKTIEEDSGFVGVYCDTEASALQGACNATDIKAIMGEKIKFQKAGSYYIPTEELTTEAPKLS